MASGVATSPEDKGRWVSAPEEEGLLLRAICIWPVKARTADACQQCWAEEQGAPGMPGEAGPRERGGAGTRLEVPPPRPPLHGDRCLLPASHPGTQSEMAGSLGVEMPTDSHTGHGSGHWYTGQKTDARLSFKTPGPAWGRSPRQMNGRRRPWRGWGQGRGTTSGALPDTHSQGPPEVQVEEVLHLMCDLKPEALADHHVPGGAELLVHRLFDHLGGTLEHRGRSLQGDVAGRVA